MSPYFGIPRGYTSPALEVQESILHQNTDLVQIRGVETHLLPYSALNDACLDDFISCGPWARAIG